MHLVWVYGNMLTSQHGRNDIPTLFVHTNSLEWGTPQKYLHMANHDNDHGAQS